MIAGQTKAAPMQVGAVWLHRLRAWDIVLAVAFVAGSGNWFVAILAGPGALGFDGRVYALAARTMLEGGNPWTADFGGGTFAGLPTGLIPYLPFAYLPQEWVAGIVMPLDLIAWIVVLRRLRLPAYWLAFPPLFESIIAANSEVIVVAALMTRWAWVAPVLKPYAVLPLIGERRWRSILIGSAVGLASLVVLPWGMFIESLPFISHQLAAQSFGSSAFGNPLLMAICLVALASMGRRGWWFATPSLWPNPQNHYGLIALPVMAPVIALCWAIGLPQYVGIIVGAVWLWYRPIASTAQDRPHRVGGARLGDFG